MMFGHDARNAEVSAQARVAALRQRADPSSDFRQYMTNSGPPLELFTIGHSTLAIEEFVALLHTHAIEHVVDVRRFPASRRHPHFARDALAKTLATEGLDYTHMEALGGRRAARPDSPNDAWRNASFRGYADYLQTGEFREALDRVLDLAAEQRVVVMCAEAVPWRCHRNLIADAVTARGVEVYHITGTKAAVHKLSPHAVKGSDGTLTYPAAREQPRLL